MKYTEDTLEKATLEWLKDLGYQTAFGPDIAPDGLNPERKEYSDVILYERLMQAIFKLNPKIPEEAKKDAFRKIVNVANQSPKLEINNLSFHKMLRNGVEVEFKTKDGSIRGDKVNLIDKDNVENNDWLAVNQFSVIENKKRRPDVAVFVNGLPLAIFELKNPADEKATIRKAHNQFLTYKRDIPSLFAYNELLVISDGHNANIGTVTSPIEWFMKWRTVDGKVIAPRSQNELKVLINGTFEKSRFVDLITNFNVFEEEKGVIKKKIAAYHQYHATNKAVEKAITSTKVGGSKKIGIVWHTQGSGKSLTMAFFTGKLIQKLNNPTVVVITDRNDLDNQLFGTFSKAKDLFRQIPKQAESRKKLKELLKVSSGGIVFTTIQKFLPDEDRSKYPLLSERRNIVVITDEAHRSQYGFKAKVNKKYAITYGLAKYVRDALPNASFIGFTATPIALKDKNTVSVFGNVIDTYDITRAVEDNATVPIYYEARLAKIDLPESEKPKIDKEFEEVTEGEEIEGKEKLKGKWARLEKLVGSEKRLKLVAKDIVEHFENRLATIEGKGMIVTMSRRIAVDLYNEIIKLRPKWHNNDEEKGLLKVVMTGSASDPQGYQPHIRNKKSRDRLAGRFKDPEDEFTLAIVRDMWQTGFDVPCLHTMYVDKPMQGHGLMQAIARVNRVYKDKQAGLIVDYIGLASQLKQALSYYSKDDRELTAIPQEEAVKVMKEKYEIVKDMYHGFDYIVYFTGSETERTELQTQAIDFILSLDEGSERYNKTVTELSYAFSLAVPHPEAIKIRDEVAFFQAILAGIRKLEPQEEGKPTEEEYEQAIKQIISNSIVSDKVINIFDAAGIKTPDISILSDEFLAEVKGLKHKNLALELLNKLLNDELKIMEKTNLVVSRKFSEMLEKTIQKYQNRTIEAAEVILELIELAKKLKKEQQRGKKLNLSKEEVAFYDALAMNESAVQLLGDKILKKMAKKLVKLLEEETTIDWTIKESVQAGLRVNIKRLLKEFHYPPDKQASATKTVLDQAELLCKDWSGK